MWQRIYQHWQKTRLKDPAYAFLFDEAPNDHTLVSLDCETTGLDPIKDSIITLAAVRITGQCIETSQHMRLTLRPDKPIDGGAITIHHLRNCDVQDGMEPQQAMSQFLHFIGNSPLLGYYLEFDLALINRLIMPWLGIRLPNRAIELSALYHDRKIGLIPKAPLDLRFDTIRRALDVPNLGAHDAYADALMVALMYLKLQAGDGQKRP